MKAYKGFNKDMTCRGYQYEENKEYECEKASLCNEGFHACEYPLDCLSYYSPSESVYHEVEVDDNGERNSNDTKIVGKKIKIGARLDIKGLIKASFDYVRERCTNNETGGDWSALTGGDWSALTGGDRSALTGGYKSALTGGDRSALTGGDCSALTGGDRSALTGGDCSALTGGDKSALTVGDWSVVYGGYGSKVKGGLRSVLAIQHYVENEYGNLEFKCIKFKEVDGDKIKPDVWYKLDKNGRFIEVKE